MKVVVAMVALGAVGTHGRVFEAPRHTGDWDHAEVIDDKERMVTFRVGLAHKSIEERLMATATPGSPIFRQWVAPAKMAEVVEDAAARAKAITWLEARNCRILEVHQHGDWLTVEGSVRSIEEAFKTELSRFTHVDRPDKVGTLTTHEIPADIEDAIEVLPGLRTFRTMKRSSSRASSRAGGGYKADAAASVAPEDLWDAYAIPAKATGAKHGAQAVVQFGVDADFSESDLEGFFETWASDLSGEKCATSYGTNDGKSSSPSDEANLDVEWIMASGLHVNTSTYKMTTKDKVNWSIDEDMLDYTYTIGNQTAPPLVQSVSYGDYGGDYDNVSDHRLNYEFQKLGLSGVSIIFASGDNGVGCSDDGKSLEFNYPDSPYITMVGGTYLGEYDAAERGATLSSGGFSKNFMRASYQAAVVDHYLADLDVTLPPQKFFKGGRAYPDVACFGENMKLYSQGEASAIDGTSGAAPMFAGIIALINSELLAKSKPPLGFLNPWLYANSDMFTDITDGSNDYNDCQGFEATKGWDPITGLGTPQYPKMLAAAEKSYDEAQALRAALA